MLAGSLVKKVRGRPLPIQLWSNASGQAEQDNLVSCMTLSKLLLNWETIQIKNNLTHWLLCWQWSAMTSLGLSSTSDVITFGQNWHLAPILNFCRRKRSFQWYLDQSDWPNGVQDMQKNSQKVERKTQSKISYHCTWLLHGKNCLTVLMMLS